MSGEKAKGDKSEPIRRFAAGVIVVCIMITLLGSAVARVSLIWTLARALVVFVVVGILCFAFIRSWLVWQELNGHRARMPQSRMPQSRMPQSRSSRGE